MFRSNGDWIGFLFWIFCILGLLKEFGGGLEWTENWASNVLKSMNWTKRKGTTGKVEPSKKFLEEEKLTFRWKILNVMLNHLTFHSNFHVTFTPNHWSNLEKCEDLFKVIIFTYFSTKKKEHGYPEDQWFLIIMDTFKGQDNKEMKQLCAKNSCHCLSFYTISQTSSSL